MNITVNGESRSLPSPIPLTELLQQLQLGQKRVAVELNGDIVPRSQHPQTMLQAGDALLIVEAIGGG